MEPKFKVGERVMWMPTSRTLQTALMTRHDIISFPAVVRIEEVYFPPITQGYNYLVMLNDGHTIRVWEEMELTPIPTKESDEMVYSPSNEPTAELIQLPSQPKSANVSPLIGKNMLWQRWENDKIQTDIVEVIRHEYPGVAGVILNGEQHGVAVSQLKEIPNEAVCR